MGGGTAGPRLARAEPRKEDATMSGSRCNRLTRRSMGILLAAILLAFAASGDRAHAQAATVRLVVDYGDGVIKTITGLPWAKGSTVLDVMNAAKDRPHGITFSYRQRSLRVSHTHRRPCQRGRRGEEKLAVVGQYELC